MPNEVKIPVSAGPLRQILQALLATDQPHLIRELQFTRGLPVAVATERNPIDVLVQEFNEQARAAREAAQERPREQDRPLVR